MGTMPEICRKVGKRIKDARMSKVLSQEELAFKARLHRTYISDVERGTRNIAVVNLEKIAKALGLKVKDLFE